MEAAGLSGRVEDVDASGAFRLRFEGFRSGCA